MTRAGLTWYQLRFPRELDGRAVVAALSAFSGVSSRTRLALDLSASCQGITHRLTVSAFAAEAIVGGLRAAMPSLHLEEIDAPERHYTRRSLWQLTPATAAIRSDDLSAISASLLASLYPLHGSEQVRLTWRLRSAARPRLVVTPEHRNQGHTSVLKAKLSGPGLSAHGELRITAATSARAGLLAQRTAAVLRSLATPHGRLISDPYWWGQFLHLIGLRGRYLSIAELAAVIGWPVDGPDLPGLELGAAKRLVPSRALPRRGRILGVSNFAGVSRPVAITPSASTRGLYLLGPTGTGKTSLIQNLIRDDLEQGRGLAVVETNGDLIQDLLDIMPPARIKDVVLLDPLDPTHTVGFNPFSGSPDPSLVADQLGELFQRLWSAFWGPRTAQLAHMALLTLAQRRGSTLLDLSRLYLDPAFRARVIAGLHDPIGLGPDWQWFERLPAREQASVTAPLLNKARSFTARPAIRAIVGQAQPPLTMSRLLREQKILLVYLPKGLIGAETAQLLGCLVLTSIWQAAAQRAQLPPAQRHPFGLYVDEVQDFAAAPIPWEEMFAQGRKYGLSLTVAHQNLDQLGRELREVILANARSKAVFALSSSDARSLERLFTPALTAADLQALDAHTIAAQVALDNGGTARPVTLLTPPPPASTGSAEQVRRASRERYARPRAEVEAALRQRLTGTKPGATAPVGRKPRRPL
jgi:Type IV secretion-system coupling protein DNA-binding domain